MRLRLTTQAQADIHSILTTTRQEFGPRQAKSYAALMSRAAEMIAENAARPTSRPRPEIHPALRSFHVALAASRRGAASHQMFYTVHTEQDGVDSVIVVRVLHERMDHARHLADVMKSSRF